MKYVGIDCSNSTLLVVAVNGERVEVATGADSFSQHSVTLMQNVQDLLNKVNLTLNDLDFIAVVVGPGSFTGIRIAVATAKALCYACNKQALVLTSFDLLAYNKLSTQKTLCIIDANHDNFYCAGYEKEQVILQPCFMTLQQIKQLSSEYVLACSKGIQGLEVKVCDISKGFLNAVEGKNSSLTCERDIVPLYVKRSQAEENKCC